MFENLLGEAKYAAITGLISNPIVLGMLNGGRLGRYAELLSLRCDREGYHASAKLRGSAEEVKVSVQKITFSTDCSSVKLEGFSSGAPWCLHILQDFVEGRSFAIPESARSALRPIAKLL